MSFIENPLVAVACVVAVALWYARRVDRPLYVMLDWDLTCDCMSTPGDEDVETNGRASQVQDEDWVVWPEETPCTCPSCVCSCPTCCAARTTAELQLFIVTRNSAANVRWMLEHVVRMSAFNFKVLSDPQSKKNKAAMLQQYLALADKDMEGVVVLADDSSSEHKKAAAYALEHWSHAQFRCVQVERPSKRTVPRHSQRTRLRHDEPGGCTRRVLVGHIQMEYYGEKNNSFFFFY